MVEEIVAAKCGDGSAMGTFNLVLFTRVVSSSEHRVSAAAGLPDGAQTALDKTEVDNVGQ